MSYHFQTPDFADRVSAAWTIIFLNIIQQYHLHNSHRPFNMVMAQISCYYLQCIWMFYLPSYTKIRRKYMECLRKVQRFEIHVFPRIVKPSREVSQRLLFSSIQHACLIRFYVGNHELAYVLTYKYDLNTKYSLAYIVDYIESLYLLD